MVFVLMQSKGVHGVCLEVKQVGSYGVCLDVK